MQTIDTKEDIPSLAEAQEYVEGWVAKLGLPNGDVLLFNEEGLPQGLDINEEATELAGMLLVGKVLHLPKALKGEW